MYLKLILVSLWLSFTAITGSVHANSLSTVITKATGTAPSENKTNNNAPSDNVATDQAPYAALITVLENEATREQLIAELRKLSDNSGTNPDSNNTEATANNKSDDQIAIASVIIGEDITKQLQTFASNAKTNISNSWWLIKELAKGNKVPGIEITQWKPALNSLLVTIIAVVIAYLTLRLISKQGLSQLNHWIKNQPESHKVAGVIAALIIDICASLVASTAGYATVIAFTNKGTAVSIFAMQFLTAFVFVELVKALARAVFSINYPHLRLLPISTKTAIFWNRWISAIVSITGYSLILLVPLTQTMLTRSMAQMLGLLLMAVVYIYAVKVVWNKRHVVSNGLVVLAEQIEAAAIGSLIRIVARIWHWLIIIYFTVLFIVSQADQQAALGFMTHATIQSVLTIVVVAALVTWITRFTQSRMQLDSSITSNLPALEVRLNSYGTAFLRGVRLLVVVMGMMVVLDAWHAFDIAQWFTSPSGKKVISTIIQVSIILLIAVLSWIVIASIIEHRIGMSSGRRPSEREKTLLMLLRNATALTIATLTILIVLSHLGIDIGPLLAGAGVAGLAIGFGAQKLVQDIITGIFIQFENGMNQNDVVEIVGLFGTVEKITIRSVAIRSLNGCYHLIPFSAIDKVSNHTRDYGYHYGEYSVAHRESVQGTIDVLRQAFEQLMQDPEIAQEVIEDISIPGVTSLNEKGFTVRVLIKTTPGNQWIVQRAYNRLVKEFFDAAGIEIPYPQSVIHFGRDKHGNASPIDVRQIPKLDEILETHSAPGQTTRPYPYNPENDNIKPAPST